MTVTVSPGRYDFTLSWLPAPGVPAAAAPDSPQGPDFFPALADQFGLKLKPVKENIRTLVIDHLELPTAN